MFELYFRDRTGMYIHSCVYEEYKENFTHTNKAKAKAVSMAKSAGRFKVARLKIASEMPDYLTYFTPVTIGDEKYYRVPAWVSSFFPTTEAYLNTSVQFPALANPLRDYQEEAVDKLLENTTWLLHAKTGTGKTYMMLEIARRLQRKTLIVVHNLTQLKQMVDDVETIMGFKPNYISGSPVKKADKPYIRDAITVLNIDSHDKITDYDQFGLIMFDECHKYMQADARRAWVGSLSAEYQYGLTGTPVVNNVDNDVFKLHYGERVLVDFTLLEPEFVREATDFTYEMNSMDDYTAMESDLYDYYPRNGKIINIATKYLKEARKGLIFTKRIEHAKWMKNQLASHLPDTTLIEIMIGETKDTERMEIRERVKNYKWPAIIIGSTEIIGTGFDLPELSFAILTTAEQFVWRIIQYVGRLLRPFPGKPQPIFIDMCDILQPMLDRQATARLKHFKSYFPEAKIIDIGKKPTPAPTKTINALDL